MLPPAPRRTTVGSHARWNGDSSRHAVEQATVVGGHHDPQRHVGGYAAHYPGDFRGDPVQCRLYGDEQRSVCIMPVVGAVGVHDAPEEDFTGCQVFERVLPLRQDLGPGGVVHSGGRG